MRIIARFEKRENVRFVSHLDVQRLFQRTFRRAGIPLAYSQGFNPHPVMAFAAALSVGSTSEAEWLDVKLDKDMEAADFLQRVNAELPEGFRVLEAFVSTEGTPALSALMAGAGYTVCVEKQEGITAESLSLALPTLLSGEIVVRKHTKSGIKDVDIRPSLYDIRVVTEDENHVYLAVKGQLDASGGLNPDLMLRFFACQIGHALQYTVHRDVIWSREGVYMPALPIN